jgi:hypothetical protein
MSACADSSCRTLICARRQPSSNQKPALVHTVDLHWGSPRRRTSRFSSGEFIRSGRGSAPAPLTHPGADSLTYFRTSVLSYSRTAVHPLNRRSRSEFATTLTLESDIAALASTGDSSHPVSGYSTPAATGMPTTL